MPKDAHVVKPNVMLHSQILYKGFLPPIILRPYSLSQQGVRASFGHTNPQKSLFKTPIIFCEHFFKISISSIYRNFACIRRTFLQKFLPIIRGCVLYTALEIQGVLHRVPRPRRDRKSMTRHYRTETPYQNKPLVCFHFNCGSNMFSTSQLQW